MSRRPTSAQHTAPTPDTPAAPAQEPAALTRRGMLLRGGLATAAGAGVLGVLGEQQAAAATGGATGIFDPFDHGAVGDGTHDDTAAIQAALDAAHAAGGGIVLVPGGYRYKLTGTLHVFSGTTVVAYGAYLFWGGTSAATLMNDEGDGRVGQYAGYDEHRDIAISGGTWDGKGVASQGFTINHGRNYTFRDVTVRNLTAYHAIDIQGMQQVLVDNCRFEGYTQGGSVFPRGPVQIDHGGETGEKNPCADITVRNCYAGASPVAGESGPWGRLIDCHTAAATPHVRIRVLDNVAENVTETAIHAYSWSDSVIEGNVVEAPGGHGIFAGVANGLSGARLAVRGNIVKNAGRGGIRVGPYAVAPTTGLPVIGTGTWSYVDIDGNQVYASASNGIWVGGCSVGSVSDNEVVKVQNPANHCVQLGEVSTDPATAVHSLTVTGNRLYGTATAAVRLNGASACSVTGNKIMGTTFTHAFSCGTVARTVVSRNDCASSVDGTEGSGLTAATWLAVDPGVSCALALAAPQGQAAVFHDYAGTSPATCGDNVVDGTPAGIATTTVGGTLLITPGAANTPAKATVTFPAGLFTTPPVVVATAATTLPGTEVTGVGVGTRTATSADLWLTRTNTTATTVSWIATGS